ncbi:MAG: SUMF1/EgtB/PvdO family nonheme iron enzyme [Sedimentisphaerales bacterium]
MRKIMYILIPMLLILSFFATDSIAKKVIQFGYDDPDTSFFDANDHDPCGQNITFIKAQPYDGTVFTARPVWGTNQEFTWGAWGTTVFSRADMQHAIDELQAVDFGQFSENFLRLNATPGNIDWFDDFNSVVANCGTAAWLVAHGGVRGLMFDLESYEGQLWDYTAQVYKSSKTFAQYQAQVRLRGQQIMTAMQAEAPNAVIFLPFAYSYVWSPSQISGNIALLPTVQYGLLPSFLDGMLDVAGNGIRFVDGYERSYGYKTTAEFQNARTEMVSGCLSIVADDAKYAAKFGFGFGLWLDYGRHLGQWHYEPNEFYLNHFTPAEFESALTDALTVSDEYVWIYNAGLFWWNSHGYYDIPVEYQDAVRFGRELDFMSFATVNDPGNSDDTRPVTLGSSFGTFYFGGVDYLYRIGKCEVTNEQYCAFLNAVAQSDLNGLYDEMMGDATYPWRGGITRSGSDGSYTYSTIAGRRHMPVNWVTGRSAMRFANWMHNGMLNDPNTTEYGAYDASTFTGTEWNKKDQAIHFKDAKYWIPTVDEWYKAAFYKGGGTSAGYWTYATASDSVPGAGPLNNYANKANYAADNFDFGDGNDHGDMVSAGRYTLSPSAYGTFDQSGNVIEFCEDWLPGTYFTNYRIMYGGAWKYNDSQQLSYFGETYSSPDLGYLDRGFRLASSVCSNPLMGDLNGDCQADFTDVGILADGWLTAAPFKVQFTSDTPGNPPTTAASIAGVVNTKPTSLVSEAGKNVSALVQNTYTDSLTHDVFGTGNVIVFTDYDSTGDILMQYQHAAADEVSSGLHTISMDFLIDRGYSSGIGKLYFDAKSRSRSSTFAELWINFDSYDAGIYGTGFSCSLLRGRYHHIDWVLDLDMARTEIYIDGIFKGYPAKIPGAPSLFGDLDLYMADPARGIIAIDNIVIQAGRHVNVGRDRPAVDLNGDYAINFQDFAQLASDWMK